MHGVDRTYPRRHGGVPTRRAKLIDSRVLSNGSCELELEEKVFHGRLVDLRTAAEFGRRFRDRVVAEAAPVYETAA
jgi:hypothetical protein